MKRTHLATILTLGLAVGLAACGDDGGTGTIDAPGGGIDAPTIDAPPANPMITITGTAVTRGIGGNTPLDGVLIAAHRVTDDNTPIATTMSNAQGMFTMMISTGGVALDGYLKATKTGQITSYLYPPAVIIADTEAPINMVATGLWDTLSNLANGDQLPENGVVALIVVNGATATSTPIAGATVSSTPAAGAYRYSDPANGLPSSTATMTHTDGLAYMFNVPVGSVTVSADKAGSTFTSHAVKGWANQLTTTLITP